MKKTILFFLMVPCVALLFHSCTNDFLDNEDHMRNKFETLKEKVNILIAEYGLEGFVVSDELLMRNINITDERLENEFKILASIEGEYQLEKKGIKNIVISRRLVKTRSSDGRASWNPESKSGKFEGKANGDSKYNLTFEIEWEYEQMGANKLSPSFTFTYWDEVEDEDGNKDWELVEASTSSKVYQTPTFMGDVDNLQITFSYRLKVTMSTGIQYFIVSGDYSESSDFCSASFKEYTLTKDEEDEED